MFKNRLERIKNMMQIMHITLIFYVQVPVAYISSLWKSKRCSYGQVKKRKPSPREHGTTIKLASRQLSLTAYVRITQRLTKYCNG